jgi:hypothetical protein
VKNLQSAETAIFDNLRSMGLSMKHLQKMKWPSAINK